MNPLPESPTPEGAVPPGLTFADTNLADPLARVRVVLCRTSHTGNIGAAARAMKTMGLSRLVLVAPRGLPDAQATAMASGADDVLAAIRVEADLAAALDGVQLAVAMTARRRELAVPPLWARDAAGMLAARPGEVALVFGNEAAGLSNEELSLCGQWAMIPASEAFSSLNLAAAVQVMAYELRLAMLDTGAPPVISGAGEVAPETDVGHLVAHFERAAIGSGFLDPAVPKRFVPRLRRLFARARVEREEVNILRGLLAALEKAGGIDAEGSGETKDRPNVQR